MAKQLCPNDGTVMHRDIRALTITYKNLSETTDIPGWSCKKCKERIFSGVDLKESARILNRLRARDMGLLEPAKIKRIRQKLNLTQEQAGCLIGGGPRAFQKYESGDLLPSLGVNNLLIVLDHSPSELSVLEKNLRKKTNKLYGHDRPQA